MPPALSAELPVDAAPTGLLLIAGLDSSDRTLWSNYNPVVREFANDVAVPDSVLARTGAFPSTSPAITRLIHALKQARAAMLQHGARASADRVVSFATDATEHRGG